MQALDLSSYRRYFPSLAQVVNGKQAVYFDNPGGTQGFRAQRNGRFSPCCQPR